MILYLEHFIVKQRFRPQTLQKSLFTTTLPQTILRWQILENFTVIKQKEINVTLDLHMKCLRENNNKFSSGTRKEIMRDTSVVLTQLNTINLVQWCI